MPRSSLAHQQAVFKNSSKTYYYSSLFFPKAILEKVTILYAFVRTADDYVDQLPPQKSAFELFVKKTWQAFEKPFAPKNETEKIITDFVALAKNLKMRRQWVAAFFASMKQDIPVRGKNYQYRIHRDLDRYIYGSAEVIGLMMCRILNLPREAYRAARQQGAAMQLINFVRDLDEDCGFGRQYLAVYQEKAQKPLCDWKQNLNVPAAKTEFCEFIQATLRQYQKLQKSAEAGYHFIPYRYRVPIMTAAQLYNWTARVIEKNPQLIFDRKIKPSKYRIVFTLIKSAIVCLKY